MFKFPASCNWDIILASISFIICTTVTIDLIEHKPFSCNTVKKFPCGLNCSTPCLRLGALIWTQSYRYHSVHLFRNFPDMMLINSTYFAQTNIIGGSKGALGTPSPGTITFIFMQFSAKTLPNNRFSTQTWSWRPRPPPRLGNAGSATDKYKRYNRSVVSTV